MQHELEAVIRQHAHRYPMMQPTDAVKLLYQNEFGGGHLIADPAQALAYLMREMERLSPDDTLPLTESIGAGIVRLSLAAAAAKGIPPETINELFVRSAAVVHGSHSHFLEGIEVLRALCREGIFAFSPDALETYLTEYAAAGYPMVSHSEIYRTLYHPAYRIVCEDLIPPDFPR